ncbi:phosphatidylinositol-4-phosphate 5-kinase family protein, partial [Reticulomyxa filosa]
MPKISEQSVFQLVTGLFKDLLAKSQLMTTPKNVAANETSKEIQKSYFMRFLQFSSIVLAAATRIVKAQTGHLKAKLHSASKQKDAGKAKDKTNKDEQMKQQQEEVVNKYLRLSLLSVLPALLTALGSDKIISDKALVSSLVSCVWNFSKELNRLNEMLPNALKTDQQFVKKLAGELTSEIQVLETSHPYPPGMQVFRQTVHFPNADSIRLTFDPRCATISNADVVQIAYNRLSSSEEIVPNGTFYGPPKQSWPRSSMIVGSNSIIITMSARSQRGKGNIANRWGFRVIAQGVVTNVLPWLTDLAATTSGLLGRLCGSLIRGEPITRHDRDFYAYIYSPDMIAGTLESASGPANTRESKEANGEELSAANTRGENRTDRKHLDKLQCNGLLSAGLEDPSTIDNHVWSKDLWFDEALSPPRSISIESKENLQFLLDYIEAKDHTRPLIDLFEKQQGRLVVNPKFIQDWKRAVRAVQATMVKHGGITSLARQYCQHHTAITTTTASSSLTTGSEDNAITSSPSKKKTTTTTTTQKLSDNDLRILSERVQVIANAIKPLTLRWMGPAAQQLKHWNFWFSYEEVEFKTEAYKDRMTQHQKTQDTNLETSSGNNNNNNNNSNTESASKEQTKESDQKSNMPTTEAKGDEKTSVEEKKEEKPMFPTASFVLFEDEYGDPSKVGDLEQMCRLKRSPFYPYNIAKTVDRLYHDVYMKELAECLKQQKPPKDGHIQIAEYVTQICQRLLLFRSCHSTEPLFGSTAQTAPASTPPVATLSLNRASSAKERNAQGQLINSPLPEDDEWDDDMDLTRSMSDYIPQQQIQYNRSDKEAQNKVEESDTVKLGRSHSEAPEKRRASTPKQKEQKSKSPADMEVKAPPKSESGKDKEGSGQGSNKSLSERVQGLRNWIGTYQQWKSWQERSLFTVNEKQSPLESIVQLIETGLDPNDLISTARAQQLRGLHRQMGLKYLAQMLRESSLDVCRLQLIGVLSESLRNSGRSFDLPLVSKNRLANLFDGLGCCDARTRLSVQKRLGECIDVLTSLMSNDFKTEVSYLTRILALSDVFSLSFHESLHETIKEQKLLS